MLKFIKKAIVLFCIFLISAFAIGCKSSEDFRREGNYQEAYDNCKDSKEKDTIIKENELAVILKNCYSLKSEIDKEKEIEITNVYYDLKDRGLSNKNIKYIFEVRQKKTIGEGYFQEHYFAFTKGGSLLFDVFNNDVTEFVNRMDQFGNSHSDSDLYDALEILDEVFGTKLRLKAYTRNYSDSEVDKTVENELALRALYTGGLFNYINGSTIEKEVIKNVNNLVISGNINNVQLIKR